MEYIQKLQRVKALQFDSADKDILQKFSATFGVHAQFMDNPDVLLITVTPTPVFTEERKLEVPLYGYLLHDDVYDTYWVINTKDVFDKSYEGVKPMQDKPKQGTDSEEFIKAFTTSKRGPYLLPTPVPDPLQQAKELVDFIMGHINAAKAPAAKAPAATPVSWDVMTAYILGMGSIASKNILENYWAAIPDAYRTVELQDYYEYKWYCITGTKQQS